MEAPLILQMLIKNNQTVVTQNETSSKTPVALPVTNIVRKRKLNDEPAIKKYFEVDRDKIVCMCGCKYKETGINRHRRV
jgi:hypothetical protein